MQISAILQPAGKPRGYAGPVESRPSYFSLGPLVRHEPRPRFSAIAGSTPCFVELDSSAVIKLSGRDIAGDVIALVESRTAQIRAAAHRLHEEGFIAHEQEGPLIVVSAIDLD